MATNNFNYYIKLYKNIPTEPFNKTELINRKQKFLLMLKSYIKDILNIDIDIADVPNKQEKLLSIYNNNIMILLYFDILNNFHYAVFSESESYNSISCYFILSYLKFLNMFNYSIINNYFDFLIKKSYNYKSAKKFISFDNIFIIIENIIQIPDYFMKNNGIEDIIDFYSLYKLIIIPYFFFNKILESSYLTDEQHKIILLQIYYKHNYFNKKLTKALNFVNVKHNIYDSFYKHLIENKFTLFSYNYNTDMILPEKAKTLLIYMKNTAGSNNRFIWIKAVVLFTLFIKK